MRERFPPGTPATDRQRDLLKRLISPRNQAAMDPTLDANTAWRLAGEYLPCDVQDAAVLVFFGENPESHNQNSAEDRVDELLADATRSALWRSRPTVDEKTAETIHLALQAVELWGVKRGLFYPAHMEEFNVYRAFDREATSIACKLISEGHDRHHVRKVVRETFIQELVARANISAPVISTCIEDERPKPARSFLRSIISRLRRNGST